MTLPNNSNKTKTINPVYNLNTKKFDLVSLIIYIFITIIILFVQSIYTLIKGIKRGVLKKEVLSEKSNLGFDLDIIVKSWSSNQSIRLKILILAIN